jgi:hypothetical protein
MCCVGLLISRKFEEGDLIVNHVSRRLEARIRNDYPPQAGEEVIAFLLTVSEDHATSRQDAERLQAAAFILLERNASRIPHVKMLMQDWRDGLVWSGLGQPDWPDRLNLMFGRLP